MTGLAVGATARLTIPQASCPEGLAFLLPRFAERLLLFCLRARRRVLDAGGELFAAARINGAFMSRGAKQTGLFSIALRLVREFGCRHRELVKRRSGQRRCQRSVGWVR